MKKLALFLLLLAPFAFAACSSDSSESETQQQPEIVYYTVSFNSDGGGDVASQTVESGKLATEPTTKPTKTGYTFSAWYSGENKFDFSSPVTKDFSLVAKWTANTYTVTLDNNGEKTEVTATYGEKIGDLKKVPELENSDFGGFYTEHYAKGTKFIDADGKGCKTWDIADDTTLYAAWGYKISYENLKECENQNPEIYTGEETVVLSDLEHISGWAFAGWFDAENGGNKVEKIDAGESGQKKLYARWQEVHYTVKHLFQNIENDEYTEDTALQETFPGLLGATTEALAKTIEGFESQRIEQKTLTADNSVAVIEIKYNRKTYNVEFDAKGGSEVTTQTVRYGAKATAPTSERTPYDLIGWYAFNNSGETLGEQSFDFDTPITANVKLYAKWEIHADASNVAAKIQAMTEDGTVIIKGTISYSTINDIATAIKAKELGIGLDLSGTNGVTSIGQNAFEGCSGLTSISIPDGVTSIGVGAFYGCSGLTSVSIPVGVTSIGNYAFTGCSGLTSVSIPAGVTSIGQYVFDGCSGLTSVSIPAGVTSIGVYAFRGCSGLTSVSIPAGVTFIGSDAFEGCSGLTSISIPDGVTSIEVCAFRGCSGLTSVSIPAGVTSIENFAFYGCSGLTSVSIPAGVTSIRNYAFSGCSGLTSVSIPAGVTFIGSDAFRGCSGLTSVSIPAGVTSIENYAFRGCSGLTSVSIPAGVTSIGNYAFADCSGLTSVSIPAGVTSIGSDAFADCSGLRKITFEGTVEQWKAITKGPSWHYEVPRTTKVTCSNGEVAL